MASCRVIWGNVITAIFLQRSITSQIVNKFRAATWGCPYDGDMGYDPNKHHRQSIRLRDYDYASPGAYFVTICLQHRLHLLGNVVDGQMIHNDAGNMVLQWWQKLPEKFPNVDIDEFAVMSNHVHGIIIIKPNNQTETTINESVGATPRGRPEFDENANGVNFKPGQTHGVKQIKGNHIGLPLRWKIKWVLRRTKP